MKIKKFNEKIEITFEIINNAAKLKSQIYELSVQYEKIFNILTPELIEYLCLHPELDVDGDESDELDADLLEISEIRYSDDLQYFIEVLFWYDSSRYDEELKSALFTKDDVINFVNYVQNPDAYKDAKKYNV